MYVKIRLSRSFIIASAIGLSIASRYVVAQETENDDDDKETEEKEEEEEEEENEEQCTECYEPLILPIIGGSNDIGFMFGASAVVARLKPNYSPYQWKGDFVAALSINEGPDTVEAPVHYYAIGFDIPGLLGDRLRIYPRIMFRRTVNAGYYGMGNASTSDEGDSEVEGADSFRANQYLIMFATARLNARITLDHDFYLMVRGSVRYVMPEVYKGSKLAEDVNATNTSGDPVVYGTDYHSAVGLGAGLVYDTRNEETNPIQGVLTELNLSVFPGKLLGLDYPFSSLSLNTRFYVPIAGEYLYLALRLRGDTCFGNPPFYHLDLGLIRGIPARRFHGMVKLLGNLEIRSFFTRFVVLNQHFGLGAALFLDSGRVFADYQYDPEVDGSGAGIKWGAGGGIRIQWGKTRIVRFDVAYSPTMAEMSPDVPIGYYLRMNHFF
jgi:Omp85 superfamily domain